MSIKITMPALSPTMEKGNLAKWLVKEGDSVRSGDLIAEIETDKATMEVEAADDGKIAKILVPAGTQDVAVNALIAVMAEDGEDIAEAVKAAAASGNGAAAPAAAKSAAEQVSAAPQAAAPAPQAAAPAPQPAAAGQAENGIIASPLARRLAKQAGIELANISGSGPRGRIIQRDIEAAQKNGAGGGFAAPQGMSEQSVLALFRPGEYEIAPHNPMRKVIARRLLESKQTVPHFYVTVDCVIDTLLKARAEMNAAAPKGKDGAPAYKLSVNDIVIKAVATVLQRIPEANVSWLESGMIQHKHSDIGVAVSIPNGLITPIVRHAEQKSLSVISAEMKDLIKRARQMKLKPEEYQGGTSSVSNMGMFGVKSFSAIVNPPQATIFAIGAGEERAVVKNGALAAAHVMSVTISADHRAVDGALAAELAHSFKTIIENPLSMLI